MAEPDVPLNAEDRPWPGQEAISRLWIYAMVGIAMFTGAMVLTSALLWL